MGQLRELCELTSASVRISSSLPLGAAKCITLPSSLNMLTSSIAWMGCTPNFLSDACSFLSSVPEDLWTFLTFRLGVPFPLSDLLDGVGRSEASI